MIKIVCVGKIKDQNLKKLIDGYKDKIKHYHNIEIIEVKDEPLIDDTDKVLNIEAERLLNKIQNNDYVILLDLHGKSIDSISLAKKIDKLFISNSNISFVIGGSLGFGRKIIDRANERIKLSDLTFLHQMTRLILMEQIYRCFKINNNETYHK